MDVICYFAKTQYFWLLPGISGVGYRRSSHHYGELLHSCHTAGLKYISVHLKDKFVIFDLRPKIVNWRPAGKIRPMGSFLVAPDRPKFSPCRHRSRFHLVLSLKVNLLQRFMTKQNSCRESCSGINWSVTTRPNWLTL